MLKKQPDLKLMIIGDGPERNNLEKLAGDLKIKNSVIFTGFLFREELVAALQANDIFLTASKSENMPLSVLEAMAIGLPVVSVREKGLAEIIEENRNGFFAQTDNPKDIVKKTLNILLKPGLIKKLSRTSRSLVVLKYSKEKVVALLENLYEKVLKN